jgi:hypothetical protein
MSMDIHFIFNYCRNVHIVRSLSVLLLSCVLSSSSLLAEKSPLEHCREAVNHSLQQIESKYIERLEKIRKSYQNSGNLEGYLATEKEIKRFKENPDLKEDHLDGSHETLYLAQVSMMDEIHNIQFELASKFLRDLNLEKVVLTKQGKIDEAIAKKQMMTKINVAYKDALLRYGNQQEFTGRRPTADDGLAAGNFARFCVDDEDAALEVFGDKEVLIFGTIDSFGMANPVSSSIMLETVDGMSQKVECEFNWRDLDLKISQASTSRQLILIREVTNHEIEDAATSRKKNKKNRNSEEESEPAEEKIFIEKGDSIRIAGYYDGNHVNVRMINCRFAPKESKRKKRTPSN